MATAAVIVFPGSNCDRDAFHALTSVANLDVAYHWHDEALHKDYRLVVLPGGFSYGDYLRAGAMAKFSPALQDLAEFIDRGHCVLGVCNGFQILVEGGFLPGALTKNRSLQFQCQDVYVRVESTRSSFLSKATKAQVLRLPIAHSEGRYVADEETLAGLRANDQIALRYATQHGDITDEANANGSMESIAGITNKAGNVLGLMPHPERCSEDILGNTDGRVFFTSLLERL